MMDVIAGLSVGLVQFGIFLAVVSGAGWIASQVSKRIGRSPFGDDTAKQDRWGWIAFCVAFAVLALVFSKPFQLLSEYNCRGAADFDACMEGDE